jgi:hypothetical protein
MAGEGGRGHEGREDVAIGPCIRRDRRQAGIGDHERIL